MKITSHLKIIEIYHPSVNIVCIHIEQTLVSIKSHSKRIQHYVFLELIHH